MILRGPATSKFHRRIAVVQLIVVAGVGALAYFLVGEASAYAVFYGGVTALLNTLLSAWRMDVAERRGSKLPQQEAYALYRSALERFVLVLLLLAAGLGWLRLMPGALVAGFIMGQLVLLSAPIIIGIEKQ